MEYTHLINNTQKNHMAYQIQNHQQTQHWRKILANGITDPAELLAFLGLSHLLPNVSDVAHQHFPLRVPHGFAKRMKKGDVNDPLLRQVLPIHDEMKELPDFSYDPLCEDAANPLPGLLHKYHGRVLLIITGACAIHCRYCFRRHFPYSSNHLSQQDWQNIIDYMREDTSIHEVIFSGGDPLLASDQRLIDLGMEIAKINHIKRLRIHTRLPIVLPERITQTLLYGLKNINLKIIMVVHCNHANEIDQPVRHALMQIQKAQITLLNQTVLLKGVNDTVYDLATLSETLFAAGVLPYYLHLLDKVHGSSHFDVPRDTAKRLLDQLAAHLPGYLVPKLVYELAGAPAKLYP